MYRSLFAFIAIVSIFSVGSAPANAQTNAQAGIDPKMKEAALKMVPNAKIVNVDGSEFDMQTTQGTVVELELKRDGSIDEASGDAVNGGDIFVPANGLIDLKAATEALGKAGKTASGDWSLEKSMIHDWIYEFEGMENGKKMDYAISAKDGRLVKNRRDLF